MEKYTKEYRDGYSIKTKTTGRSTHKLPFFCPNQACKRITDTLDDRYLTDYGICAICYINLVENRTEPLIDINTYRKRLSERGY